MLVKFFYHRQKSANYYLKGGKGVSTRTFFEQSDVDIPEIAASEALVVLRWQEIMNVRPRPAWVATDVRVYDGTFITPYIHWTEMGETLQLGNTPREFLEASRYEPSAIEIKAAMPSDDLVEFHLGNDFENSAQYLWEQLVIVEDRVYRKCEEPVFRLNVNPRAVIRRMWTKPRRIQSTQGKGLIEGIDRVRFFSVVDNEAMLADLNAMPAGLERDLDRVREIEVVDPSAFTFDRKAEACGRTVGQALVHNGPEIHTWPFHSVTEFAALRADYEAWLSDPDKVDVVSLLERTRDWTVNSGKMFGMKQVEFLRNCRTALSDPPDIHVIFG